MFQVTGVQRSTPESQEMLTPAGRSGSSISVNNVCDLHPLVGEISPYVLDKQTLPVKVTPLCLFSPGTPQNVSAGGVITGARSFTQARSGSHSTVWVCVCTRRKPKGKVDLFRTCLIGPVYIHTNSGAGQLYVRRPAGVCRLAPREHARTHTHTFSTVSHVAPDGS